MQTTPSKRLLSLDAFRGLTIIFMTLVNNPGSWRYVLPPLRHAEWHGCTPTDLVFPFFLFIMGVAMAFSFARRLETAGKKGPLYLQIVKRTALLLLLGWFLNLFPEFDFVHMRLSGVLQRIGLCYFFASLLVLHLGRRGQVVSLVLLLVGYWAIMALVPFPGRGADPWALGSNLAQYVDNLLLKGHMWKPDFDPEGFLSTLPAIASTLFGYLTGQWLRSERAPLEKTVGMFVSANLLLVVALVWATWMPLNKQLWTSSYVLYTTGLALHFLAMSYWAIDIKGWRRGLQPLIVYGSNAILAYFGSSLLAKWLYYWQFTMADGSRQPVKGLIYSKVLVPVAGNWGGSLLYPFLHILLWLGILTILYRKRVFIKL
ncbi:MAG: DUF5009 domain-containing protein [bacterium]|jgi:predicted acyltransferase|nr:DUF5009 domain-containing protein [candidate division KSB1 bacterium]MDH7561289.1 DUF5009 domain-containing protein [bacterium]